MGTEQTISKSLGMSDADLNTLKTLNKYTKPLVSPWWTLALGALAGYDSYQQNKRAIKDQRRLAAETARLSPWTGMRPQQLFYNDPSAIANAIGGLSAAQGVISSINQYSPAIRIQQALQKEQARRAAEKAAEQARSAALAEQQALANQGGPIMPSPRYNTYSPYPEVNM